MAARTLLATVCVYLLAQITADCTVLAADGFDQRTFLKSHCYQCHGPEKQEAKLRLDQLPAPGASNFDDVAAEKWALVADMVAAGDMPPAKQPRPAAEDVKQLTTLIGAELARATEPVPALRRLNRTEYQYTLHDLLQIDTSLAEYLPEDGQVQGFDNVAGGLGISSILLERYL